MPQNIQDFIKKDEPDFSKLCDRETEKEEAPQAKQENPKSSIYWALVHALEHCNEVSKTERSRELSLVITKLEEAQMWYERIYPPKSL